MLNSHKGGRSLIISIRFFVGAELHRHPFGDSRKNVSACVTSALLGEYSSGGKGKSYAPLRRSRGSCVHGLMRRAHQPRQKCAIEGIWGECSQRTERQSHDAGAICRTRGFEHPDGAEDRGRPDQHPPNDGSSHQGGSRLFMGKIAAVNRSSSFHLPSAYPFKAFALLRSAPSRQPTTPLHYKGRSLCRHPPKRPPRRLKRSAGSDASNFPRKPPHTPGRNPAPLRASGFLLTTARLIRVRLLVTRTGR